MLTNLVANAIKFTLRAAERLQLPPEPSGENVTFCVADTGGGIPRKLSPEFLTSFAGAIEHGNRYRGTGLQACHSQTPLVELHGGRVSVSNEPGHWQPVLLPHCRESLKFEF
ncbi:MAG: hypothetical protein IPJ07_23225 [Acidobacteria bacterium]|nr:hypothetical protein [Acidobacteriota bacterium]